VAEAKRIYVIGAGGHAKVVADIVNLCRAGFIHGFIDDVSPHRRGEPFYGGKVIGTLDDLFTCTSSVNRGELAAIVAVGDCRARMEIASKLEEAGFELLTLVHPSAVIASTARMAKGTVVCANACINVDSIVGQNVIVNTASIIEHDCLISDGVHLAPRSTLGGWCKVGTASLLGIGSVCRDRVSIGEDVTIGAGAVVVKDVPTRAISYGNPARVQRFINER
jgi:UDP-N-acetylbacillosamine N-acetyltransferase